MKLVKILGATLAMSVAGCAVSSEGADDVESEQIGSADSAIVLDGVDLVPAYFDYDNHFTAGDESSWIRAHFNSHAGKRITVALHPRPEEQRAWVGFNLYKVATDGSLRFSRAVYGSYGEAACTFTSAGTGSYVVEMVSSGRLSDLALSLSCKGGDCSPDAQPGDDCGGFAGIACAEGLYCAHAPETRCGAADRTGVCSTKPQACTRLYKPVCGCDGQTYGNSCSAASAGVSVQSTGECGPTIAQVGESCGGFRRGPIPVCAEGLFCDYTPADSCGWADAAGTCAEKPALCAQEHAPVCGCDQQTYDNACAAAMKGVAVYQSGACESQPAN